MDEAEKRRLKKLGKQKVQEQSRALEQQLNEANPAAVGSDEWVSNYKKGVLREQTLRAVTPDRMSEDEALENFVVHPVTSPRMDVPVRTWYAQCAKCRNFVHTRPAVMATCECGAVSLWVDQSRTLQGRYLEADLLQVVRLIGRGDDDVDAKPWWKIW